MTRLSSTAAAVAGAALVATSSAFSLSGLPSTTSASISSASSSRRCVRSRACSAAQQPSMVASVPRTVVETGTGTDAAPKQRLHVQVSKSVVFVVILFVSLFSFFFVCVRMRHVLLCVSCMVGPLAGAGTAVRTCGKQQWVKGPPSPVCVLARELHPLSPLLYIYRTSIKKQQNGSCK